MSELISENIVETVRAPVEQARLIAAMSIGGLLALAAATGLLFLKPRHTAAIGLIAPTSPSIVQSGAVLYLSYCASCHGARLEGRSGWRSDPHSAPPLDGSGHAVNHSDLELFTRVANGARAADGRVSMPAFRSLLSDQDAGAVMSYIASHWSDEILRRRSTADWRFSGDCGPTGRDDKAGDRT